MPTRSGLVLLTAGGLGAVAIVVDVVAVGLRRPAASGLALLALYAVPTAVARDGVPWVLFAVGAAGYLLLLMVEGRDRLVHWGRPVGTGGPSRPDDADAPLPLTGQRIGAVAIAIAVVLPVFVPGLTGNTLSRLGRTGSGGSGTGTGGALNEFAALRGELRRGAPYELMRVTTDLNQPLYLRTKVLDRYQSSGFAPAGSAATRSLGSLLSLPRRAAEDRQERGFTTQIRLSGRYRDDHLPIYYLPSRVKGTDDAWGYDAGKAVVVGRERAGDFEYTVEGVEPTPCAEQLASPARCRTETKETLPEGLSHLPPDAPGGGRRTVEEVTRGLPSPYLKAKAINDFFTDGSRGFRYALTTMPGNSGSALVDFLREKQGYCEQYAAAMAVMLRVAEIPSRVVIGYTAGRRRDDGSYSVTTSDAHAWVEGYFEGVGWVYFDPTPLQDGRTVAPGYAPRPQASPTAGSSRERRGRPARPGRRPTSCRRRTSTRASPRPSPRRTGWSPRGGRWSAPACSPCCCCCSPRPWSGSPPGAGDCARRAVGTRRPRRGRPGTRSSARWRTTGCRCRAPRHRAGWPAGSGGRWAWTRRRPAGCGWSRSPRSAPGTRRGPASTATCRARCGPCGAGCGRTPGRGGGGGPRCCRRRRCGRRGPGRRSGRRARPRR